MVLAQLDDPDRNKKKILGIPKTLDLNYTDNLKLELASSEYCLAEVEGERMLFREYRTGLTMRVVQ